jgi:DNA-binding NtrC family response regulator
MILPASIRFNNRVSIAPQLRREQLRLIEEAWLAQQTGKIPGSTKLAAILEEEAAAIDLIVSDVVMPEMDGPTLLKEARARGITARFIFVSGYAEEAFRKNLPEGEEFGFLPKPFSLKQLIETVKNTVG